MVAALVGLAMAPLGAYVQLFDVFAHVPLHLAGTAVVAGVALVVPRHGLKVMAFGLTLLLAVIPALSLFHASMATTSPHVDSVKQALGPARSDATPAKGPSLRVLAFNTWHRNHDLARLQRYLLSADADVIVLSEFGPSKLPILAALKARYPHTVSCAENWHCSLVILSRHRIVASQVIHTLRNRPGMVIATLDMPAWPNALRRVTLVGTHIFRPTLNPWRHYRHMDVLLAKLASLRGPLVVAGDFNATPFSWSYKRLLARARLRDLPGQRPTWPAWPVAWAQFALDHVVVSPSLAVVRASAGPAQGSDHLPIWAEVRPARQAAATPTLSGAASDAAGLRVKTAASCRLAIPCGSSPR
ncbi:MAG: endonuclease/exonuclease/phosphatase family protein [Pseudomonadota bacterium]